VRRKGRSSPTNGDAVHDDSYNIELFYYYLFALWEVMSAQVERTRKARGFTFLFGRLLDPQDSSLV
jgi:hypothetical protein